MTSTEERLRDALGAAAAQVRDDRLRPLPAPETRPRWPAQRRHMGWLGPAAAAISVLLIVALALTLTVQSHKNAPPVSYPGLPAGFPKYFAQIVGPSQIAGPPGQLDVVIRSTSTGAEVTRAAAPDVPDWRLTPLNVATAPDGRSFYIEYRAVDLQKNTSQIWIYLLTFTHGGSSNYLAWIKGDPFPGSGLLVDGGSMAASPDGRKLAFTETTQRLNGRSWPDAITVVDLRTGARSTWQGGMSRPGQTLTIPGISWTPDGRSLVFRAVWCRPIPNSDICLDEPGQPGYRAPQIRSLDVATKGGTFDHGSTLRLSQSALPRHRGRGSRPGRRAHRGRAVRPRRRRDPHRRTRRRRREAARRALPVTCVRHRRAAGQRHPHPQRDRYIPADRLQRPERSRHRLDRPRKTPVPAQSAP